MKLNELLDTLAVQSALLDELLAVFERETVEMGEVNVSGMADVNQAKETLINKIAEISQSVQQAVSGLAVSYGLASATSLKDIAGHLAQKGDGQLLLKLQRLSGTTDKIKQAAALNMEIAERFSSTITTSLTLITRLINQSNVYGATGGYQRNNAGAVMINREA